MAKKKRRKRIHIPEYNQKKQLKNTLTPKTIGQNEYIRAIAENKIIFCTGPAGSGKSYCAAGIACQKLFDGEINTIIITRPVVGIGSKSMGFLPGTMEEKMDFYVAPIIAHLKHFLGEEAYNKYKQEKKILISPLEYMRGKTFDNSFILLDEAQNTTYGELKMFISRYGRDSKMVLNGDIEQSDLRHTKFDDEKDRVNGFARIMRWMKDKEDFGVCQLQFEDIVREQAVATFLKTVELMEKEEGLK